MITGESKERKGEEKGTTSSSTTSSAIAVVPIDAHVTAPPTLKMFKMGGKAGRTYRTRLGYIGAITTNSTGAINAAVNCSTLNTTSEFSSIAGIFDEYFIHSFKVLYEPFNQFFGPAVVEPAPFTSWSSGLLIGAPLYHGAASYLSASSMINNIDFKTLHTGRRWTMVWTNNENPKSGVVVAASTSSSTPTQGWCPTTGTPSGFYTGALQFRTSLPLSNTTSITCGQTVIMFDVSFRVRA